MNSNYETTECFAKLVESINRGNSTVIMRGGQGSGKTTSILMYYALLAASKRNNLEISIVSDTLPNLKKGPIKEFEKILKDMGLYLKFTRNKQDNKYTIGSNYIEFFSVDSDASALGARRTHLYVNEANKIDFDTYDALSGRSKYVILDFNPIRRFWVDDILDFDSTEEVVTTYLDNHKLPEKEVKKLEWYKSKAYHNPNLEGKELHHPDNLKSKRFLNKWKSLGLAEYGSLDGLVFKEHQDYEIIDELPKDAKFIGAGLDFGFSHVSALVKIYEYNDDIILDEYLFQKGLTVSQLAEKIKYDKELMSAEIACDNSRPEMINELSQNYFIPAISCQKGKGSVEFGLDLMFDLNLKVTKRSKNIIYELSKYAYKTDKNGNSLGIPDKSKDVDNSIDAARYGIRYFYSSQTHKIFFF